MKQMFTPKYPFQVTAMLMAFFIISSTVDSADWPVHRHDLRRSAVTPEAIDPALHSHWTFIPRHAPQTAWPLPGEETPRMHSDRAHHVVAADGRVFFGSTVDNQVYALDAVTGRVQWTFFTGGPVRFAPVWNQGRLYFGSDDGIVYCLEAKSGDEVWKYRPSPSGELVVGNGRLISLWPVRVGLAVEDGMVYLSAGVFPYEGIYVAAIDAATGMERWKNDTAGDLSWGLDHGGITPHGYLVLSKDYLYVPSGRAMPTAFDRHTGKFHKSLSAGGKTGGAWALLDQDRLIAGVNNQGNSAKIAYEAKSGKRSGDAFASFPGIDLVMTQETAFSLTEQGIISIHRTNFQLAQKETPGLVKKQKESVSKITELRNAKANLKDDPKKAAEMAGEIATLTQENAEMAERLDTLNKDRTNWTLKKSGLITMAVAGPTLVAGGDGVVVTIDSSTGKQMSKQPVKGTVLGLAVADGRVFANCNTGRVYCFGKQGPRTRVVAQEKTGLPYPEDATAKLYQSAAETIMSQSPVRKGFCLVLNAGRGQLAHELAKRSTFNIVGIESNPVKRAEARKRLTAAGLYGSRIVIEPWEAAELPDYFANLIVCDRMVTEGRVVADAGEVFRVLRPFGGALILGQPTGAKAGSFDPNDWFVRDPNLSQQKIAGTGKWWKFTRGQLEGAGSWSGLYGNAANTGSSTDELVRGPMGVLWYGEPGSEFMLDRHARSVSPLAVNGRLFVQGMEVVMGYDGYNGTQLWQRRIPGAVRVRVDVDSSNIFATGDSLFVAAYDKALQLDAQTGKTLREFVVPERPDDQARRWAYIAVEDGILFGSTAKPLTNQYGHLWNMLVKDGQWLPVEKAPKKDQDTYRKIISQYPTPDHHAHDYFKRAGLHWHPINTYPNWLPDHKVSPVNASMMVCDSVFAHDIKTGKLLWQHHGERIPHIALTAGQNMLFVVEEEQEESAKALATEDQRKWIQEGTFLPHQEQELGFDKRDFRRVNALDIRSGKPIWTRPIDLSGCGAGKLGAALHDGRLLFFGHYSNHDQTQFAKGELAWRRITTLDSKTGNLVWSKPLNYRRRPLIMEDTIFIEPRACSLSTGEVKKRVHPLTGKLVEWEFLRPGHSCGVVTASPHSIFYRSYCAAIVNLERDSGLQLFGGLRPGCWNNLIPANGLLNFQEASAGCTCSYPIRSTVVLKHKQQKGSGEWGVFITSGAMTPVSHFAINLGAPGDMRDDDGILWFGYPRPKTSVGQGPFQNYGVKFDLKEKVLKGMGAVSRDFRGIEIAGTDKPWLFTSGVEGMTQCKIHLIDKGQDPGIYKVRIGFAAEPGDKPGQRVFGIRLQGKSVAGQVDAAAEAALSGGAMVREFEGIRVGDDLTLELKSSLKKPSANEAPLPRFIEVIRQDKDAKSVAAGRFGAPK